MPIFKFDYQLTHNVKARDPVGSKNYVNKIYVGDQSAQFRIFFGDESKQN